MAQVIKTNSQIRRSNRRASKAVTFKFNDKLNRFIDKKGHIVSAKKVIG